MIAGSLNTFNAPNHSLLLRLNADGSRDTSFGVQGARVLRLDGADGLDFVGLLPDGETLLVGGSAGNWIEQAVGPAISYGQSFVGHASLDGEMDETFGTGGVSRIGLDCASSIRFTLQADGAPVMACWSSSAAIRLARLSSVDGNAPGLLSLSPAGVVSTCESCDSVTLLVTRTGGRQGAVSVNYRTVDESASAGSDFLQMIGLLSWADGETDPKVITIPILPDSALEGGQFHDAETSGSNFMTRPVRRRPKWRRSRSRSVRTTTELPEPWCQRRPAVDFLNPVAARQPGPCARTDPRALYLSTGLRSVFRR